MSLIVNQFGNLPSSSIMLHTRAGSAIANAQDWHLSTFAANQNQRVIQDKKWSRIRWRTTTGSPVYNCHGLTFAGRRTNVIDPGAITQILREDAFSETAREHVLPGDVVLYFTQEGEAEHSGVVASVRPGNGAGVLPEIWVFSKWGSGSEALHLINDSPYNSSNLKFFRVTK